MTGESYTITLRPLPGDSRPGVTRLRMLLKFARRAARLQCVRLTGPDAEPVRIADHDLGDK